MRRRLFAGLALLTSFSAPLAAQAPATVPSPKDFFGFEIGADRKLADWDQLSSYFDTLARTSGRVRIDTLGTTTLGRPFVMATITSEKNQARLEELRGTAPETSSLVAIEAMASGTPVVCFASGALPEVVEDGRTGLIVEDVDAMAKAIHAVGALDARTCREAARERFSAAAMGARYLELYRRVLGEGRWTDAA